MKRLQNIKVKWQPLSLLASLVVIWQLISSLGLVEKFILPSPLSVAKTFYSEFGILASYSVYTLTEAFIGLFISIALGYAAAVSMDRFGYCKKALYPLLVLSQTVPYIAIAPLLVLWFGFGMAPKIILVSLTCFFPLAVNIHDGICGIRQEYIDELKVMGGGYFKGLIFVKLPLSLPGFFTAIKIATTYSIVGAVISEWIGGTHGLGVYMTRVRRSYEFDKMFAVIAFVVLISLLLITLIKIIERKVHKHVDLF